MPRIRLTVRRWFFLVREGARRWRHERTTCPRRMGEVGPWKRVENEDWWATDRWTGKHGRWPWPWAPRTCSFCGGVRPDDAIRLAREGWEVEPTDKGYKWYLEPPGYRAWMRWNFALRKSPPPILTPLKPQRFSEAPPPCPLPSPAPPLKLYAQHFTEEQVHSFNEAVKEAAAKGRRN